MALNRQQRRKTAIKGKTFYGEIKHTIMIADLKVYVNKDMPDGVMIVNEKEGERLRELIDAEVARKAREQAEQSAKEMVGEEGKVSIIQIMDMIADLTNAGATVTPDDYVIYATEDTKFSGSLENYPLEIVRKSKEEMPDDTVVVVAKREGK